MDCDGPKHALIRDLDGTFIGTEAQGSIVPFAELRWCPISLVYKPSAVVIENNDISTGLVTTVIVYQ